jgi:hypothetical protein
MPTYGMTMIIGAGGPWSVTHWRGDAAFSNGLEMVLPFYHFIVDPADHTPTTYVLPELDADTELRLHLLGTSGTIYNTSGEARFSDATIPGVEWWIDWEDWVGGDYDYNDSHSHIYQSPEQEQLDNLPLLGVT